MARVKYWCQQMSNTISDLNAALFKQLERLNADDMNDDQIKTEVERTRAVVDIAGSIVESAELVFAATKFKTEYGLREMPEVLSLPSKSSGTR